MRRRLAFLAVLLLVFLPLAGWWLFVRPVPVTVTVYFVGPAGPGESTLVPVERVVRARSLETRLHAAFLALLAGPTPDEQARGIGTAIPEGTVLRGVAVADDVAVVDLSREIEAGGGAVSVQARVWQLVYTGTQFPAVRRVQILIEGQRRAALGGEGFIIDAPLSRPASPPSF